MPKTYSNSAWDDIPAIIAYTENILRAIVFILPVVMIFSLKTQTQKIGFGLYILGIVIYFSSWTAVMFFSESSWSKSLLGFMAPAYTTIIWLVGIGLIGHKTFLKIPFMSPVYIVISVCFAIIHSLHSYIAYKNNYEI